MSNQPIDNRDLRIFDLNVNESLGKIGEAINNSTKIIDPALEEININLAEISGTLNALVKLIYNYTKVDK